MGIRRIASLLTLSLLVSSAQASWYDDWTAKPAWPEPISLLTGVGLTYTALALRGPLINDFQYYETTHRPLGPWSKYGDYSGQLVPNILYAGGMGLAAWLGQAGALNHAELMITASAEAVLITTVLKYTVRERRPDSDQLTSFPSGHATSAFAFASVIGVEHGWTWGIPAYLLAGFVGWSRINDNEHFVHDVIAGAAIGISTGLGVYMAREHSQGHAKSSTWWQVVPVVLPDGGEMLLQAQW